MKRAALVIAMLVVACGKPKDKAQDGTGSASAAAVVRPKPAGPSVTPIITDSITFVVPKDPAWWGELSFACYASVIDLQPGNSAGAAIARISPTVAPATAAAGIDLDHDLAAFGLFGCGEGPCIYTALALKHPEKLPAMLEQLVPGTKPKLVGKDHYTLDLPGATGPRTIHVQAIPIAWPDKLPSDAWSRDAAKATHVIFISGIFGAAATDPLALLADPATAAAKVHDAEGVLADPHGRCVLGLVGKREFQPGYQLDHARFAFAAPEGNGDALTRLLDSRRTLDLEVELTLAPAPTAQVADGWIAQARAWMSGIAAPIRAQFSGQGPIVDVMFDLAALLADRGFRHPIKDKALTLSWRTDRVPSAELAVYETRLEQAMKAAGLPTP